MILSLYAEKMSERGRQGRKRYFPPGLRELWGGLACPSRISFSTSCAFRKHVSSPWPGNQPFFRPNASRSTAWPGKQPFFRPNTSRSTAWPGNQPFFRPYPSQMVFSLDKCWFSARLSTQSLLLLGVVLKRLADAHPGAAGVVESVLSL